MSKKPTRRQARQYTPTAAAEPRAASTSAGSRLADRYEFNPDYSPVIKDLKRIAFLAGTFFMVLIALAFILR
jgi:hypothetical protein